MLSLFRLGPKMIVIGSEKPEEFTNLLLSNFEAVKTSIVDALNTSYENSTIVFITKPGIKIAHIKDIIATIYINLSADEFYTTLINKRLYDHINDIRSAPGMLIMRTQGDKDKIISSVAYEYKANMYSIFESLDNGSSNQTIIFFTDRPLNSRLTLNSFETTALLIDENINTVSTKMRTQALRFLNEGLVDRNWYEVKIRIYDRYSEYDLHYKRLSVALDNLDIGLILGESWTKDTPRFLLSVLVYQVKLFTLLPPTEIKKILLGLEYADDGTRIVDLDLIYKNKKIDWTDVKINNMERKELGMMFRQEILNSLNNESKKKLLDLENVILNTRS
ncbi:hypothetical protein [Thermobrachium celere]|uniref:Uncharacterized protein n=1 Tax=Thermobrachium celere DSM 8682 TaxID=941824 RepID=R7RTE7_9CLOT|nr:hypothetical protein [Thermobrachium celere]CDF58681.1 hypothetical protein TCEL_00727 [Thermobrachium celere DSM 8682]